MEVINIDSSDDEDVPLAGAARILAATREKERASCRGSSTVAAATRPRYVTQETNPASYDDIWNEGLPSKSMKNDASVESDEELEIVGGSGCARNNNNGGCSLEITRGVNDTDNGEAHTMEHINETRLGANIEAVNSAPTVDAWIGHWKVMLLMDLREFGQHKKSTFLQKVEKQINKHFGGEVHCEKVSLPSADYMFVARLISNANGEVIDERVLDLIVERKNVNDLQLCLTVPSKKYKPLSFFEAQMYKLQNCGVTKKIFLMEGDEDNPSQFSTFASKSGVKSRFVAPKFEQEKRLKRVKTVRLQIEKGEWHGVETVSTNSKEDTVKFLIQQLEMFKKSFDPMHPPDMTMEDLKMKINMEMKAPTFQEYLRQTSLPGIGDKKAMKVIMDPELDWDKTFISPAGTSKFTKSTLEDRPTFWGESSREVVARHLANARAHTMRSKKKSNGIQAATNKDGDPMCGLCRKDIDIFDDTGIVTCNRVSKCGATFHAECLSAQGFDIGKDDGCIVCRPLRKFSSKSQEQDESSSSETSQSFKGRKHATNNLPILTATCGDTSINSGRKRISAVSDRASKRKKSAPTARTFEDKATSSSKKSSNQSSGKKRSIHDTQPQPKKIHIKKRKTNSQPSSNQKNISACNREISKIPNRGKIKNNIYVSCGICNMSINVMTDMGIVNCNRTTACGAAYHLTCLTGRGYDLHANDGCIKCESKSKFSSKNVNEISKDRLRHGVAVQHSDSMEKVRRAAATKDDAGVIVLDFDDVEKEGDDAIVID
mmetsp:Transcript_3496/g.8906  ORF Transcript_3496/g.8906 Transcript_3496/m.8906 type:complete len:772 (-) Transcript_3496:219-2534(-)